jgi:hypothetical protein
VWLGKVYLVLLADFFLKMEMICSSETSGCFQTTWHYDPEVRTLYSYLVGTSNRKEEFQFKSSFTQNLCATSNNIIVENDVDG